MKSKKLLCLLLSIVMAVGLMPMAAFAAEPASAATMQYGEKIGTSTNGKFVDEGAEPGKKYEYTVLGSDNSVRTVEVAAEPATGTGNTITEQTGTGTGEVYYQKVTNPANANGEGYLLVSGKKAVTHEPGTEEVTVTGDRITGEHTDAEWNITKPENGKLNFAFGDQSLTMEQTRKGSGSRRNPYTYSYEVVLGPKDANNQQIHVSGEQIKLSRTYYEPTRSNQTAEDYPVDIYLQVYDGWFGDSLEAVESSDSATSFTLYKKVPAGTQYTVNTDGLDGLLNQSFTQSEYTADSWQDYETAKADAEAARGNLTNPYDNKDDADAALATINQAHHDLNAAINGLKKKPVGPVDPVDPVEPGQCVNPQITWHRTWEPTDIGAHNNEKIAGYPNGIQHLENKAPWLDIIWKWNDVKNLTASNPNPWNAGDHKATWSTSSGSDGNTNWMYSNVRRFTGTFTWPEGVGMDAEMTLQSVNDSQYQFIYDYIDRDPALKERYGNAKVLPINDDMYVFISKASDGAPSSWDAATAQEHMMFWTGTTGKGTWSKNGNTGMSEPQNRWEKPQPINDWSRTEPARFLGKTATPAFYGSWPNLVDTGKGTNANVEDWVLPTTGNPMTHTDSWYTLTDTNAMKSTLNTLYGSTADLGGQEMRIDIYAFNNSGEGGMDELMLTLCTPAPTTAQVQVDYWLDDVKGTPLGSTVMTKNIGETVNLLNGTNTNELNHKKAEAIRVANNPEANVTDGKQVEKDFVVQQSGNVINVVYTRSTQGTTFFTYDFGVQNEFHFKDENETAIRSVNVECRKDTITANYSGHEISLTYTPKDASGTVVNATLVVDRTDNSQNRYPVMIIPASNVLYEEDRMHTETVAGAAQWNGSSAHNTSTVADNETTVFGWTQANAADAGENGAYTATVTAAGATSFTDYLNFEFTGRAFDLIGSCGPNTGTLIVSVNSAGKNEKLYMVDTSFSRGEIHQVPLVHSELVSGEDEAGKTYQVEIRGANIAKPKPAAVSTFAMDNTPVITPEVYELMQSMGLTDEDIANVEFIGVEDQLDANVPVLMSAEPAANGDMTVSVDGFRVYRKTRGAQAAYPETEADMIYTNVMADGIRGSIAAYIENETGTFEVSSYENMGGPENEIYLAPQQAVAFQLTDPNVHYAQISARAVQGPVMMEDGAQKQTALNHNTEMYYEVAVQDGMVIIGNNSTDGSLLALGNLKAKCGITAINTENQARAVEAAAMMFGMPEPEIPEPTVPETFTAELQLAEGAVWADETIPETDSQTAVLNAENASAALPELIVPRGMKLLGWSAKDIGLMIPAGQEVTLEQLQGFEWADAEPTVVFQPVFEALPAMNPARFHVVFQLTDGAEWDNDRFAPDEAREYNLYAGRRNLRAPEVEAPEGFEMTGWQAQEIDLTLEEEGRLTLRELKKNFTWYDMAPTITFLPVFVAEEEEVEPEPTPEVTPEPTPEVTPEPTPEVTPEPTPEVPAEPVVFRPERLDLALSSENNVYTLVVKASADVDHLTVNGDVVSEYVEKADFNEFTHIREGYQLYEIVAYDANGNASETYLR